MNPLECHECGKAIVAGARCCTHCGFELEEQESLSNSLESPTEPKQAPSPEEKVELEQDKSEKHFPLTPRESSAQSTSEIPPPKLSIDTSLGRVKEGQRGWFRVELENRLSVRSRFSLRVEAQDESSFSSLEHWKSLKLDPSEKREWSSYYKSKEAGHLPLVLHLFVEELKPEGRTFIYTPKKNPDILVDALSKISSIHVRQDIGGKYNAENRNAKNIIDLGGVQDSVGRYSPVPCEIEEIELQAGACAGWVEGPRCMKHDHVSVDVCKDGVLEHRFHLLFKHEVKFGRNAEGNDVALRYLPSKENGGDEENDMKTAIVSRKGAFCVKAKEGETVFYTNSSSGVFLAGKRLSRGGKKESLPTGQEKEIQIGAGTPAGPFCLKVKAIQSKARDRENLLKTQIGVDAHSGIGLPETKHSAVRVCRVGNLDRVQYVMAPQGATLGGAPSDVCQVLGIPRVTFLRFFRREGNLYLWCDNKYLQDESSLANPGLWRTVQASGEVFKYNQSKGDGSSVSWEFRIGPSNSDITKSEQEVLNGVETDG